MIKGLSTALVELDDFSSGTSSRSTKLIHGGVRYLQKAILKLDMEQYKMVKEALQERANLLEIAPHLSYPLPIMLPVYHYWQIPYFWVGIKMYDLVAGTKNVKKSYYLSKKDAMELFPMLKSDSLVGAIVYYDGQHNDARMNLSIALTAARYGATIANHVAVTKLNKDSGGKLIGARLQDQLTKQEWDVKAKVIVNATGPFTDSIRLMDNQETRKICQPSSGVHIVLPGYYSPESMGLLDPSTSDGRVIFFLPWEKWTIAGTTDKVCEVTHNPAPTESDIQFILSEIRHYLSPDINVRRGDVMSAWAGIRPLVLDPSKPNTESIARNHIIDLSPSGLVTVAGGKWTTYRVMAQEAIDAAVKDNPDKIGHATECKTLGLTLEGGHKWTPTLYIHLVQDFGLEPEVAHHLANTYGDKAFAVAKLAELTGRRWPVAGRRLHVEFPYIEAEIRFAVREYACTAVDVIARRLRLAFLNTQAAEETLPRIVDILAEELKWSKSEKEIQLNKAKDFLRKEMGQQVDKELRDVLPISLTKDEINKYSKQFHSLDRDRKGYIGINDLRRSMKAQGVKISEDELHQMLSEVDINKNGQVELGEYLELMSAIKTGTIAHSRFSKAAEFEYNKISVDRAGGGL
ncbi:glycerol-3-phosphate dehydrogenase, mitochondrial-like [Oppia nitens]|uniref:glycerol-3-phosphate dehydrogenase, mitochondrial-like n=1 Tax=Oppia nitens TaxID=1686743 RepID=UPI0023DA7AA2|nr:glycerol-3-phosphate dehydrogenase, mitochondrial-like [Oppia nitens]